jgi:hypothetical protein
MWQLTRNSVNELAATFQDVELAGIGADYLVEFSALDQTAIYVMAQVLVDTSRSTQFTIELNSTEDAANGIVQLRSGHYDVNVYRQTGTTLDPNDVSVDGLIFTGEAFVENATGESEPIYYTNTISASVYYERI